MDTELYEEAVRDYEKVYQTEKTTGNLLCSAHSLSHRTYDSQTVLCLFHCCRSQTSTKDGTVAAEEEQEERLLQGAGSRQECHRR